MQTPDHPDPVKQPSSEEMAHDELYQDWSLPFYQKVRQEAEAERLRAEQSERKTERLAAKRREPGIDPQLPEKTGNC